MGNSNSSYDISFEDMLYSIKNNYTILTTLTLSECENIIQGTVSPNKEEEFINKLIDKYELNEPIIIYGRNTCDMEVMIKYKNLKTFGFTNIFIYRGGMFEWMMLQDIYGNDVFITTKNELDILKFKPEDILIPKKLLTNS
tara:strand:+ start:17989 stop:18411 length:423 start_codon:yes stop_codon:yes gene_type:complete